MVRADDTFLSIIDDSPVVVKQLSSEDLLSDVPLFSDFPEFLPFPGDYDTTSSVWDSPPDSPCSSSDELTPFLLNVSEEIPSLSDKDALFSSSRAFFEDTNKMSVMLGEHSPSTLFDTCWSPPASPLQQSALHQNSFEDSSFDGSISFDTFSFNLDDCADSLLGDISVSLKRKGDALDDFSTKKQCVKKETMVTPTKRRIIKQEPSISPMTPMSCSSTPRSRKCPESPESKRRIHNVLERKRRNDLKMSYQELREQIPELADNERTPTGQILIKAHEYITHLQEQEAELKAGIAAARAENMRLLQL